MTMDKNLDIQLEEALRAYLASGVEDQVDYQKFYLYSIVTHSTAIEGSTVTEIENQLLFDEGITAKGRSLIEQMMNVDLKDAYLYASKIVSGNTTYTPQLLQQLAALVMRRTGSEYSTIAGKFDSSKGEFRLCNVSAGIGGRSYLAYNKGPRLVPPIVRKEDKGEYIQSLVDSREHDDSTIAQDIMLRHHIDNLNLRVSQYQQDNDLG